MPHPRSAQDDAGISSIIGFIAGFALLAGSMAAVAYFMVTIPEAGSPEESKDLESYVQNAADALTKSPGHPHEWHESGCQADTYGLLRAGTSIAQLDKLTCFKTGDANATTLLEANDLRNEGIRLYAEGTVVPLSTMQAPSTTEYALLAGDLNGNDLDEVTTDQASVDVLDLYENADEGFESEAHEWAWRLDRHPEEGLGNTFVDHPWHVHTQMTPFMAGLKATYTMADIHDHGEDWGQAAMAAADSYTHHSLPSEHLTRWHIASECPPDEGYDGDYFLTASYRHDTGADCADGWGLWRTTDGMRTFSLIHPVDITGATDVNLSFMHALNAGDGERPDCHVLYDNQEEYQDCVEIRPSIRFWNTTEEAWTRLNPEPSGCEPAQEAPAWNDTGDAEAVGPAFEPRTVDLCEAVEHTDGELWVGFDWFSECKDSDGNGMSCADATYLNEPEQAVRAWMIDSVQIVIDGEPLSNTTFDPGASMETLVISQGVDNDLHGVFNEDEDDQPRSDRLLNPIYRFIEAGGNLIAFAPGEEGNLFAPMGLEAIEYTDGENVETKDADRLIMRMPHELPLQHSDYQATPVAWEPSEDISVQWTSDEKVATLVTKATSSGAKVTGVAYDITSMDTDLRDKLLDNLYTSAVFLDPTFKTTDSQIPASATVPVSSAQRIVLAEATETGEHHVPLEVTVYAWPEGLG